MRIEYKSHNHVNKFIRHHKYSLLMLGIRVNYFYNLFQINTMGMSN